ncbi:hypothetical protein GOY14_02705 [Wolbachia endosymbiont of Dipetalonema caudispina]|uniref:hypothetical protein n=1 Tax=Wolbachia endosymbiont of Dipetalonema caudispina TaxID=1812112 RepID=UPI00158E4435|nr:hypothetical protein [Wolbachia endosymbiont of Dipetalonema caudispina]QKX01223.1 hypothetical protein GOY14_02705 [Wolbachia endosymbiont of Dipetalonema caudispina]
MNDQNTNNINSTSSNNSIKHKLNKTINFTKNKVINTDGLTLVEVFQALIQMLNSDLELVKKVLTHANIMVKHGMKVAKESELSRVDVLRFLESKKKNISRQKDYIRKPSPTPIIKSPPKKGF